ncbi:phosphotransferase [Paenibacillus sp. N3/727]|uniref:phosphotransferase enzyme family protein n=1 Tax=Paenibacillus sp. N3/727 TaxID=2925845 RepID=UPI001F531AD5|nr:phosphotransferase [Paenibacillus sp. N3/727]UNK15852.1 phosphotransferase [Paenibacillus sp. N3/727]
MEERILQFLNKTYPINFNNVEAVTNEMYRCLSTKGIFFVRITNYKTYHEQLEEVNWTNYLFNQGIGVPMVIPSINDSLIENIMLDEEKMVVLFQAASGIHLPRSKWNKTVFRNLGQQMGRMHRVSKGYMKSSINHWYECEEYDFLKYIPAEEKTIREIAHVVLNDINELPQDNSNYGLIHGDLWLENVLVDSDSKLTMIDFQDCENHYYVYDLAVPIYSALEFSFSGGENIRDYERSITEALIDGYKEENDLSSEMLMKLPRFMKLKEMFEYNLMHMYWNSKELSEEQVRILNLYRNRIEYSHS